MNSHKLEETCLNMQNLGETCTILHDLAEFCRNFQDLKESVETCIFMTEMTFDGDHVVLRIFYSTIVVCIK